MKDNWIKPFQDRLGEYELDLPQAAARPRKRIILPLLTAAAAAAVLLLVFLPSPSSRRSTPGDVRRDGRLIAEIPATLSMEMPEFPETPDIPVEPEKPALTKQQLAQGVEYLATHNRWNRDEMEKIPALAGLWDAVNTYELDEIRGYNERLASTPLTTIVDGLERSPKQGYYAAKTDHVITLSTYIKRLR